MKKKLIITVIVVITVLAYGVYWSFFDLARLPIGELISEKISPDGVYTVKAYLTNGGATVAYAIRGELNFNTANRKPKNIYWNYREEDATIEWMDENTVIINGIELDVPNEKFDFRRE
ncbi:MAG: DUF5412 domain-containing protein [Dethiosulfatibacter sp.]|nr:DUF5412 domain-containing protein [Dethiosulfatibacter sp.]